MTELALKYPSLITEHSITEIKSLKDVYSKDNTTLFKYYDISSKEGKTEKESIFLMSGEHPREMIAVEAAYQFVEDLLSNPSDHKLIFDNYKIRFVLIANPYARIKVEEGEYCRRLNPNNVDLNRNWDIYWGKKIMMSEENPGKKPFSEVETRFLKHLMKEIKPKIFLTLHSGIYGLYMPHAFEKKEGKKNNKVMKDLLNEIKEKYCPICGVGAPSLKIGYQSSGTCLDYTYEKMGIPYAFVWEIYTDETKNPQLEMYKLKNALRTNKNLKRINNIKKNSFLEVSATAERRLKMKHGKITGDDASCISLFNPLDELGVTFIKKNWSKALKYFFENLIGK